MEVISSLAAVIPLVRSEFCCYFCGPQGHEVVLYGFPLLHNGVRTPKGQRLHQLT